MAEHWLDLWRDTLDSGLGKVLTTLVSESPQAAELRQNSPFAGILPDDERIRVLTSFRKHWPPGARVPPAVPATPACARTGQNGTNQGKLMLTADGEATN